MQFYLQIISFFFYFNNILCGIKELKQKSTLSSTVVTIYTTYFNTKITQFFPHGVFMCCVLFSQQTAIFFSTQH